MVVRTTTPAELVPYTVDLSDYSPMRTDNSEIRLSCAPGGPHCAELDQPRCADCLSFCKEPGGPSNRCFCRQEAENEAAPKYVPSGDETVHNLGAVYPHPGGSTPGLRVSRIFRNEEPETDEDDEDTSDDDDYQHDQNPFPVPTVGCPAPADPGVSRGRTATNPKPGTRTSRQASPTPCYARVERSPTWAVRMTRWLD